MDVIFDFISTHFQLIINLVILAISIVVFILRKPSKTEIYDASAYNKIAILIKEAEEKFGAGNGEKKLAYVLDKYCNLLSIDKDDYWTIASIKHIVEFILSTPSKK